MIVIKIELWPNGFESRKKEIGRMHITNKGTSKEPNRGDYKVEIMRRGTTDIVQKESEVINYPRKSYSVWVLIHRALKTIYE